MYTYLPQEVRVKSNLMIKTKQMNELTGIMDVALSI